MVVTTVTIYTDGGARGNPGPAASGVYSPELGSFKKYLGVATNNQAEYQAILLAMEQAVAYQQHQPALQELKFFMDSELAVKQLNREYRVKDATLQGLFIKIWNLTTKFKRVTFTHIPREQNKPADRLVNEALDEALAEPINSL
ncbi:MAG: ribonuclease HI family protein [Candidatus Kerfeldbacteria bacterium]|nr:ribonuclease HI family protein [Candidatus Kerfeldbacteria bacterium]